MAFYGLLNALSLFFLVPIPKYQIPKYLYRSFHIFTEILIPKVEKKTKYRIPNFFWVPRPALPLRRQLWFRLSIYIAKMHMLQLCWCSNIEACTRCKACVNPLVLQPCRTRPWKALQADRRSFRALCFSKSFFASIKKDR